MSVPPPDRPPARWLTRAEAGQVLGVAPSTVGVWVASGRLRRRPGTSRGRASVDAASVDELAAVLEKERAAAAARRTATGPPDDAYVWVDTATVAVMVGLSRQWATRRAREGRIPATWHGGRWWVRRDHAEQYAAGRAVLSAISRHACQRHA